jgi:hypothetical protein
LSYCKAHATGVCELNRKIAMLLVELMLYKLFPKIGNILILFVLD